MKVTAVVLACRGDVLPASNGLESESECMRVHASQIVVLHCRLVCKSPSRTN